MFNSTYILNNICKQKRNGLSFENVIDVDRWKDFQFKRKVFSEDKKNSLKMIYDIFRWKNFLFKIKVFSEKKNR